MPISGDQRFSVAGRCVIVVLTLFTGAAIRAVNPILDTLKPDQIKQDSPKIGIHASRLMGWAEKLAILLHTVNHWTGQPGKIQLSRISFQVATNLFPDTKKTGNLSELFDARVLCNAMFWKNKIYCVFKQLLSLFPILLQLPRIFLIKYREFKKRDY